MAWLVLYPNEYGELIPTPEKLVPPLNWYDEDGIIHSGSLSCPQPPAAPRNLQEQAGNHSKTWLHAKSLLDRRERIQRDYNRARKQKPITRDEIIDAVSLSSSDTSRERIIGGPMDSQGAAGKLLSGYADKLHRDAKRADRDALKMYQEDYSELRRLEWARYRLPLHMATVIEYHYFSDKTPTEAHRGLHLQAAEYDGIYNQAIDYLAGMLCEVI